MPVSVIVSEKLTKKGVWSKYAYCKYTSDSTKNFWYGHPASSASLVIQCPQHSNARAVHAL